MGKWLDPKVLQRAMEANREQFHSRNEAFRAQTENGLRRGVARDLERAVRDVLAPVLGPMEEAARASRGAMGDYMRKLRDFGRYGSQGNPHGRGSYERSYNGGRFQRQSYDGGEAPSQDSLRDRRGLIQEALGVGATTEARRMTVGEFVEGVEKIALNDGVDQDRDRPIGRWEDPRRLLEENGINPESFEYGSPSKPLLTPQQVAELGGGKIGEIRENASLITAYAGSEHGAVSHAIDMGIDADTPRPANAGLGSGIGDGDAPIHNGNSFRPANAGLGSGIGNGVPISEKLQAFVAARDAITLPPTVAESRGVTLDNNIQRDMAALYAQP